MQYDDKCLKKLIKYLLTQRREADFWDVKQEWHKNIENLIKDIICFANTVHNKDCYLIIGITDDLKICGIGSEDRRRRQSDVIDTLSKLPFAGDNVPKIEVKTVLMPSDFEEGKVVEVDVLIIFNSYSTPYYLKMVKDRYKNVMVQGCIYSRVADRNTPDKSNSEIQQIEMLWKKRFGLTKSSLEYIIDSLNRKLDWQEHNEYWYNIYRPEYILRINYDETTEWDEYEFYSYSQDNESTHFYMLDIIANNTVLEQYQVVCLDSGRLCIPVPEWSFLNVCSDCFGNDCYKYYIKGSNRYKLLKFMFDNENSDQYYAFQSFKDVVLIFESEDEKENFEGYLLCCYSNYSKQVEQCNKYNYINTGNKQKNEAYKRRLHIGVVLNEMLKEFRSKIKFHRLSPK